MFLEGFASLPFRGQAVESPASEDELAQLGYALLCFVDSDARRRLRMPSESD